MADYQCHPLWHASSEEFGDIAPDTLPISASLQDDLKRWAKKFDDTLDLDDCTKTGFKSREDADNFVAESYVLLRRLREELGPDYEIISNVSAYPKSNMR